MDAVPIRYLDREGAALAYQVVGSAPVDVVWYLEINQHLDLCWTDPSLHRIFEHGATYSRTAYLQRRGFGLSEPIKYAPSLEQQADDILAVMDDIGMQRALLVGHLSNCGAPALVAARSPNRVSGLVLVNPVAQGPGLALADLVGWTRAEVEAVVGGYASVYQNWGSGESIRMWDPVLDTPFNRRLGGVLERCSATPATAAAYADSIFGLDVSDVLRTVRVPTQVLRVPTNSMPDAAVAYVADLIPEATLHVLPVAKPGSSIGEAWGPIHEHIEVAATGEVHRLDADRFLGTVLFTDVVGSTALLAEIGDARYRELRDDHERQVRFAVEGAGGRLVKVIGDGTLSVFDGPATAVHAADAISESAAELGLRVRAGVHTGEIEPYGPDIHGMTVHIGARVAAAAGAGEVLVSRTVRDLVMGSGLRFVSRGEEALRGVPGTWELFSLSRSPAPDQELRQAPTNLRALDRAALQTARRAPRVMRAAVRVGNAWQRRRAETR